MEESSEVREILEAAKEMISDEKDWRKGWYGYLDPRDDGADSGHCAVGALKSAMWQRGDAVYYKVFIDQAATKALYGQVPETFSCVEHYNDHSDTTHQDILDLYDRAIKEVVR